MLGLTGAWVNGAGPGGPWPGSARPTCVGPSGAGATGAGPAGVWAIAPAGRRRGRTLAACPTFAPACDPASIRAPSMR